MPPTWVNPDWLDDDIFKLSKLDIDMWKTRVATTLGYRYKLPGIQGGSNPYAKAVGGLEPISQDKINKAMKAYVDALRNLPSDASLQDAWRADLRSKSQLSTVVNGCFLNWESVGAPWNTGYIASFWSKFESGEKVWDTTLDRKAGGIPVEYDKDVEISALKFSVVGASSIMALMRAVLGHVVRTGQCPEDLKLAFGSIKITWLFGATDQEILTLSVNDNIGQHNGRRHTELDNISQAKSWVESTKLIKNPPPRSIRPRL